MESLFFILCAIQICVQMYSVIKLTKTKDEKYWNICAGISIAAIMAYVAFKNATLGLGGAILCLVAFGFSFISNLVMLIIGKIIKLFIRDKSIKMNKSIIPICILVVAINAICLFAIPVVINNIQTSKGEKLVVDYLEKKYGAGNYEIVEIYEKYENSGMENELWHVVKQ